MNTHAVRSGSGESQLRLHRGLRAGYDPASLPRFEYPVQHGSLPTYVTVGSESMPELWSRRAFLARPPGPTPPYAPESCIRRRLLRRPAGWYLGGPRGTRTHNPRIKRSDKGRGARAHAMVSDGRSGREKARGGEGTHRPTGGTGYTFRSLLPPPSVHSPRASLARLSG